ncbi:helix-turn-helix domain-containing protein [Mesorhizobium sp. BE184]|uniref:helix-turn-helix domain-containing protein n=1 Tax=Mesorhizobium sp. BE184 TaxID=2817714 RepID=UPI002857E391|nr:helix-turn-helix domain-containing protein [Mesorhizobium sp. BE184]MDR7035255.1 chromosomal replication initiator protein [Mesorhizobium sp. BE184]
MTIAVCGRATMANAKRIVFDEGINIAPRKKSGRERLIELSLRWSAEQAARREAEQQARDALQRTMAEHRRRLQDMTGNVATDPKELISMVAAWHGLEASDILASGRSRIAVEARYDAIAAVHLLCKINGRQYSTPLLGRLFRRDHTTIIHALRKRGLR